MKETPIFMTGNAKKAEELGRHINYPITHQKVELTEIQGTLREVIEDKARRAYDHIKKPVLVEDTSLRFSGMGNGDLPGVYIKAFLDNFGNEGLCRLLNIYTDREAIAEVMFGLYNGQEFLVFAGQMEGTIAEAPRGEQGFGWDPIFIPEGHTKTWGEMTDEEKDATSMRKIALQKLEAYLKK